jgi:hypothetical protein
LPWKIAVDPCEWAAVMDVLIHLLDGNNRERVLIQEVVTSPFITPDERELIAFQYTIASPRTQTLQFALMYVLYLGFPVIYV